MSIWELPTSAEINGRTYAINSDFRAVLDVLMILGDSEITDTERGADALFIFYPEFEQIPYADLEQARDYMQWFIGGGDIITQKSKGKLADWKQDFPLIIAPINRVLGFEARQCDYLHWWTFLSAYNEIGDCLFAQVVSIRSKKRKGKKLEKWEKDFYNEHRGMIDFHVEETQQEKELFDYWFSKEVANAEK